MIFLKAIVLICTIFVTLLWITKLLTDFAAAFMGSILSNEERMKDAYYRIVLMGLMSVLWTILIIM